MKEDDFDTTGSRPEGLGGSNSNRPVWFWSGLDRIGFDLVGVNRAFFCSLLWILVIDHDYGY
jgi:hypothetical protein